MAYARFEDEPTGNDRNYKPLPGQLGLERNSRRYEDRYPPRDPYRRQPPSPRRCTPPHDRSRTPPRVMHSGRNDSTSTREWDIGRDRDYDREYDNYPRGRSPSTRSRPHEGYRDRDREGYRSPGYDDRSRSQSPRRDRSPYFGGPPSREIMMDGLPLEISEEDISEELKQFHNVDDLDDVRVIRDRQTKQSRGFGFLRFSSVEKSKAFLERNYPIIYLYGKGSEDGDQEAAKVRLAFSRERDDRSRPEKAEGEWTCRICNFDNFAGRKMCFKCHAPQIDTIGQTATHVTKSSDFLNNGDSDASPNEAPSQFLLFRGLEPSVSEDLFAKGAAKLYKPSGGIASSSANPAKKGNAKVASTTGDANLGAKEGSLRRILLVRDRKTNESWRYGFAEFAAVDDAQAALVRFNSFEKFTISSKPVLVCYIHAGVFVPVFNTARGQERFTFSPLSNSATKLAYWDQDAYVSELVVSAPQQDDPSKARDAQVKPAADQAAAAAEKEGLVAIGNETEAKTKKRKNEVKDQAKQKKTAPAHLQFWSNRHAELHGVKPQESSEAETEDSEPSKVKTISKPPKSDNTTPAVSYADPVKKCCYLCSRQFKSDAEVNKHERLSQLHRDNLQNDELKAKAVAKMVKAGLPPPLEEDTPEYRDRAKERRAAFGASKRVSLPMKKAASSQPSTGTDAPEDGSPPAPSKGASLLGKMGWAAGEGLGAQGKGMTAPIATEMYVQGVGLGAQGGKMGDAVEEAERNTKGGYEGFLERTKDKAKERFERLG